MARHKLSKTSLEDINEVLAKEYKEDLGEEIVNIFLTEVGKNKNNNKLIVTMNIVMKELKCYKNKIVYKDKYDVIQKIIEDWFVLDKIIETTIEFVSGEN